MRCPTLSELPVPPPGKIGWPWMEDSLQFPDTIYSMECKAYSTGMPDGHPWPKISIVTPSYNQGQFIEETIRSVLLQGYPNLEYMIIDGGSTDNSVEIIKKYEKHLAYWVSEKDRGQAHAINKGLKLATGEFAAYQNADDIYWANCFERVGTILGSGQYDVLFATADILDEFGQRKPALCPIPEPQLDVLVRFWNGPENIFPSQGFFARLDLIRSLGFFDEGYYHKMDYDLFCRILDTVSRHRILRIDDVVASFRIHPDSKTAGKSRRNFSEGLEISRRYWNRLPGESPQSMKREALVGEAYDAMHLASAAVDRGDIRAALKPLLLAWHRSPRLAFTRWSFCLFARILRAVVSHSCFTA